MDFGSQFGGQIFYSYICKKCDMVIVNTREFRANQGKYLEMVDRGQGVILRARRGSYKITPVTEDDTLMSKEELFRKIDKGIQDIKNGKGYTIKSREELERYLDSL